MFFALVGIFYLDNHLDQINISDTIFQTLLLGRTTLPAGLVMLVAFWFIITLGARELSHIFQLKGLHPDTFMLALAGILGCTVMYVIPYRLNSQLTIAIVATLLIIIFFVSLIKYSYKTHRTQGAAAAAAITTFAFVYMGLLPGFFIAIRRWHTAWVIAAIILITKSCDIGAYFTGRFLGKRKLIEWLSPKKTWEGLIGGVTTSALAAVGFVLWAQHAGLTYRQIAADDSLTWQTYNFSLPMAALAGALIGLIGQFGDLTASLLKRDAGIKDSGQSIPGFGGLLDIVDSPLATAPLAYWLITLAT